MTVEFKKKVAVLADHVTVEDAEPLLEWLQQHPGAAVNMRACTHVHPATLQVLLAAKAPVSAWPIDAPLTSWLQTILTGR